MLQTRTRKSERESKWILKSDCTLSQLAVYFFIFILFFCLFAFQSSPANQHFTSWWDEERHKRWQLNECTHSVTRCIVLWRLGDSFGTCRNNSSVKLCAFLLFLENTWHNSTSSSRNAHTKWGGNDVQERERRIGVSSGSNNRWPVARNVTKGFRRRSFNWTVVHDGVLFVF